MAFAPYSSFLPATSSSTFWRSLTFPPFLLLTSEAICPFLPSPSFFFLETGNFCRTPDRRRRRCSPFPFPLPPPPFSSSFQVRSLFLFFRRCVREAGAEYQCISRLGENRQSLIGDHREEPYDCGAVSRRKKSVLFFLQLFGENHPLTFLFANISSSSPLPLFSLPPIRPRDKRSRKLPPSSPFRFFLERRRDKSKDRRL